MQLAEQSGAPSSGMSLVIGRFKLMKRLLRILPIILIIAALVLPLVPAQVVLADPGWLANYTYRSQIPITGSGAGGTGDKVDYYITGDDGFHWSARPGYYIAQSFTTTSSYATAQIKVKTFRANSPGTVTVGIRNVDGSGKPTGAFLTSGTTDANAWTTDTGGAWYTISVGSYTLATSTQYCIVIEVPNGDVNNYITWRDDSSSPTYTGGAVINMDDSVWQDPNTAKDRVFEVWSGDTIGAGKYYTVSLTVHSGGGSNSDGVIYLDNMCEDFPKDIRFTKYSSAEIIPYWLEPGSGSPRTFHIQVPTNLNYDQNIYIYFGNPTPTAFDVPPLGFWVKPASAFGQDDIVDNMVYDSTTNKYYIVYYEQAYWTIGLLSATSPDATSWTDEGAMLSNGGDPTIFEYGGLWYIVFARSPSFHYATASSVTGPYTEQGVLLTGASEPGIFYNEVNGRWELLSMLGNGDEHINLYYSSTLTGSYTTYGGNPIIPPGESGMYDEFAAADAYGYVLTDNIGEKHSYYFYTTGRQFEATDEQRCVIAYTENDFTKRGVILYYDTAAASYDKVVIKGGISRFGNYYYMPFGTVSGATRYYAVAKQYAKSTDSGFPPQQVFIAHDDFSKTLDQWSQRWGSWSISAGELRNSQAGAVRIALMNNMPQPEDAWEYSVKLKRVSLDGYNDAQTYLGVVHAVRDQPGASTFDCYYVAIKDNNFYIGKYVNNADTQVQDWTATTVDVDTWNTLTIRHTDDNGSYTVLLNDTPIYSGSTTGGDWEGSFGVMKLSGISAWDDFKVTKYASTVSPPVVGTAYTPETTETPSVTTNEAVDETGSSATLQGTLTNLGDYTPVYVSFGYGLTTAYGTNTEDLTKTATGGFNQPISGLTPDTTYHFRARVRYDGAYSYGLDDTFVTTALGPPTVTTTSAVDITSSSAILQGTLDSLGDYSPVYVYFEWGPTVAYERPSTTEQTKTSAGGFSAIISGLTSGTTYHYKAVVRYDSNYAYGDDKPFAYADSMYEYYNTGDDAGADCYGATWTAQTFTTDDAHTVVSVRLKLYRVGEPGVFTVSIRETSDSDPIGTDLTSGVLNANTLTTNTAGDWYEVVMTSEYALEADTMYSVVARAVAGDASNKVVVRFDTTTAGYTDGAYELSANSGVSWTTQTDDDLMFEVYGNSNMEVISAKVFVLPDAGWLITTHYLNEYPPYYLTEIPQEYFKLQLVSGSDVIAQVGMPAWGYVPGSLYICGEHTETLQWGSAYEIRLYGRFEGNPTASYTLTPADWLGSDLNWLDSWVITTAGLLETYYGATLTTYTSDAELVLDDQGATIFMIGIPGLNEFRPDVFANPPEIIEYEETEWTRAYEESFDWETLVGDDVEQMFIDVGGLMGLTGKQAAQVASIVACIAAVAILGAAGAVCTPVIILIPVLTGLISVSYIGVAAALVALLVVWMLWFRAT